MGCVEWVPIWWFVVLIVWSQVQCLGFDLFSLHTGGVGVSFRRRREGVLFLEVVVFFVFLLLSLV